MSLLKERHTLRGLPEDSPVQGKIIQQMDEEALMSVNQKESSYGIVLALNDEAGTSHAPSASQQTLVGNSQSFISTTMGVSFRRELYSASLNITRHRQDRFPGIFE